MPRIAIERHRLENGLDVVLSPDPHAPIVAVNLWYAVGSRHESPGRTGFAHLFEHMMFQGSQHVSKNGHFELIERAGGTLNGSTWFDRTNYYETLPAHHLDLALWLESDRLGWLLPAMTQEKLDNQREVVKNEKRQRYDNRPYGDWSERMQALVFPEGHPYRHTVIGSMDDLEAATLDDVSEFFRSYYVPDNCVLTVCGDIAADATLERIHHYFGPIPPGDTPRSPPPLPDLDPVLGHTVHERVVDEVPLVRTMVACRIPPATDPVFPTGEVAAAVLSTGRASRLYRSLVLDRAVAKGAGGFAYPLVGGASMALFWATGLPGTEVEVLEEALLEELGALSSVGPQELGRAVAMIETSWLRSLEEVEERADLLSRYATIFDDPTRIRGESERLRAVTVEDVRDFADEYFDPDNRAVLSYLPLEDG